MPNGMCPCRLRQVLGTLLSMVVGCQRPLNGWLSNMHGRHPVPAIGWSGIFGFVLGLLPAKHALGMPGHPYGQQKRLLLSLKTIAMEFLRFYV